MTSRSSGYYCSSPRHTPSATFDFVDQAPRRPSLVSAPPGPGPLSTDEMARATRNAGGDARAVVVGASADDIERAARRARVVLAAALAGIGTLGLWRPPSSAPLHRRPSHDAWVPTGFGKRARRVVTASDRRVSARTRRAGTRRDLGDPRIQLRPPVRATPSTGRAPCGLPWPLTRIRCCWRSFSRAPRWKKKTYDGASPSAHAAARLRRHVGGGAARRDARRVVHGSHSHAGRSGSRAKHGGVRLHRVPNPRWRAVPARLFARISVRRAPAGRARVVRCLHHASRRRRHASVRSAAHRAVDGCASRARHDVHVRARARLLVGRLRDIASGSSPPASLPRVGGTRSSPRRETRRRSLQKAPGEFPATNANAVTRTRCLEAVEAYNAELAAANGDDSKPRALDAGGWAVTRERAVVAAAGGARDVARAGQGTRGVRAARGARRVSELVLSRDRAVAPAATAASSSARN